MLELRPKVNTQLLEQTRVNSTGFDKVDYTYNLLHHCRKIQRQMLCSKVFAVQKTVDDLDTRTDLLDSCSKPVSSIKHCGCAVRHKLTQFSQLIPSFCWKMLKMLVPVAVVVSSVQNRNSFSRSVSPSYLT